MVTHDKVSFAGYVYNLEIGDRLQDPRSTYDQTVNLFLPCRGTFSCS